MKRLVAEVTKLPSGSLLPQLYCVDESGFDRATTETLLDLICESSGDPLNELEALVDLSGRGSYVPADPNLPDWGINEKYVWLVPPMASEGSICISNEYSDEYSRSEGQPQLFTYKQFHGAVSHWRKFLELLKERGRENLVGQKLDVNFE